MLAYLLSFVAKFVFFFEKKKTVLSLILPSPNP